MTTLINLRISMAYALFKIAHLVLLALLFLALAWLLFPAFIFISIGLMAVSFYRLMQMRAVTYQLCEQVLLVNSGIFFKRTDNLELYRIRDQVVTRNLLLQVLGLMTIELLTTDRTDPVVRLSGIPFSDLPETIRDLVQKARMHSNIVELN